MYHLNKSGVLLLIRQKKSTSLFVIILPGKNKLNDFEMMRRYESFRVLFEAQSVIAFCFGHLVNRGNFCLWNPEAWALELGIQLMESGIPLTIGVRNPVLGIRNPRCGIHNPRLSWIPLRGAGCKQAWILRTRNKHVLKFQELSNSRFIGDTFSWEIYELKLKSILKRLFTRRSLKERYQTVLSKEKVWSAVIDLRKRKRWTLKWLPKL